MGSTFTNSFIKILKCSICRNAIRTISKKQFRFWKTKTSMNSLLFAQTRLNANIGHAIRTHEVILPFQFSRVIDDVTFGKWKQWIKKKNIMSRGRALPLIGLHSENMKMFIWLLNQHRKVDDEISYRKILGVFIWPSENPPRIYLNSYKSYWKTFQKHLQYVWGTFVDVYLRL